jgi:hypothetical protein
MLSDDVRAALFAREEMHAKTDRDRVRFRCPRHEDSTPSAWMQGGSWGCFACNFTESISTLAKELGVALGNGRAEVEEATFDYVDEAGRLLFQVVRFWPKRFLQRRPDGQGGWEWKTKDVRRVLYRLPEVLQAARESRTVYVVEGEKHADRLAHDGLVATTNPGGAGKWKPEFADALRGAHVVVLPDNDEAGRQHGRAVAQSLRGKAADVRILELPGLPQKGDVIDWLAEGHTTAQLDEMAFEAEPTPADEATSASQLEDKPHFPPPLSIRELLQQPEPEDVFIIEPFLPADGNVLLAAYPKCFKTGFLLSLSIAAATSRPFLGMFAVPRRHRVGLVLMEDRAHRIRRRLQRLCLGLQPRGIDMELLQGQMWLWFRPPLLLSDPRSTLELGRYVQEHEIDLLIVDSWSYVATGNPNDADIVTPQLMALSGLRAQAAGLTTLLVHHARKTLQGQPGTDDERLTDVIRNSSAFGAWYDSGIVLSRQNETAPIKVRMELRDLPAPDAFTFTLEDEHPAGPDQGLQPDGWIRMVPNTEHPAVAARRAAAKRLAPAVLDMLRANPGLSKRQVRERIGGRAADVDSTLEYLRGEALAQYSDPERKGQAGAWYATSLA